MGLVALVVMSLISVSCTEEEFNSGDILGAWQSAYVDYKVYSDGKKVESGREEYDRQVLKFMAGGEGEYIDDLYEEYVDPMTWTLVGSKLTLDIDGNVMHFTLSSVNSETMVLKLKETDSEDGVKITSEAIYTYNRFKE